jgi:IS4 transposase
MKITEHVRNIAEKVGKKISDIGFYVTDVPEKIWEAEVVGTVYRLRWQIELTFKDWKSLMNIHILRGTRKERVGCFLYGRLISVVVATIICGFASWYAYEYLKKEVSFHKIISWLRRKDRLAMAIRSENPSEFLGDLIRNIS